MRYRYAILGACVAIGVMIAGFLMATTAHAQGATSWIITGGGDKYLKPINANFGLLVPGLATSTTGCLSVGSNGWISANGSSCGGGAAGAFASSSPWTAGFLSYIVDDSTFRGVATTTLTATGPLFLSNPVAKVGGSDSVLTIATTTDSLFSGTAGQVLAYLNGGWFGTATTTFGDGLTYTSGDVDCDTADTNTFGCLTSTDWDTFNSKLSAAITAIGPAGQTQSGATITLATSTSASNGLTPNLVITGSGDTLTFTSSLSGTLTPAGGGTGTSTNARWGDVLYWNGTNYQGIATTSLNIATAAGGSDTEIQYNDGGVLAGATGLTYDKTNRDLTFDGNSTGDLFFGSFVDFQANASGQVTFAGNSIAFDSAGGNDYYFNNAGAIDGVLDFSATASSDKTYTFPNLSGVPALGSYTTGFTGGHIPFGSSGLLATSSSLSFDGTTLTTNTLALTTDLSVANGGTGVSTFTSSQLIYGNGTNALSSVATSSFTLPSTAPFNPSGTLGALVGGTNFTLGYYGLSTSSAMAANQIPYGSSVSQLASEAEFTYTASTDNLTVVNATTTNLSSSAGAQLATAGGKVGIASTSPFALLGINAPAATTPFAIGSSTGTLFSIDDSGQVRVAASQPATSTSMTLDWSNTPQQVEYRIGGSATTIQLVNATTSAMWGSTKRVYVCNPGGTAGALTWTGVQWIGTAPTQTTTADKCDLYSFNITRATSSSAYIVAGTAGTGL